MIDDDMLKMISGSFLISPPHGYHALLQSLLSTGIISSGYYLNVLCSSKCLLFCDINIGFYYSPFAGKTAPKILLLSSRKCVYILKVHPICSGHYL